MPPSQVRGARLKNRDELRCEGEVGLVPGHCVSFFLILFLSVPSRLVWVLAHPVRVSLPPNVILINPRLFLVIHPFCVALPSPPLSPFLPSIPARPLPRPPRCLLSCFLHLHHIRSISLRRLINVQEGFGSVAESTRIHSPGHGQIRKCLPTAPASHSLISTIFISPTIVPPPPIPTPSTTTITTTLPPQT